MAALSFHVVRSVTVLEPASWGRANLLSYADSDFESGVGNWVNYSNSRVSQDDTQAFLHGRSLRLTARKSGSQAVKLGIGRSAPRINVAGGNTYRISAWLKTPASSPRIITFAAGFYTASGTWLGWTSGARVTLGRAGGWQYVSDLITAPSTAAYALGSPRLTETGVRAGETLNVDEVLFEPYRAATWIGAEFGGGRGMAFPTGNRAIGPIQSDKVFYSPSRALPTSYTDSSCAGLPPGVTCLVSYKVMTTHVASFVGSIPADKPVILTYWQEPENDSFSYHGLTGGPAFVAEFESQSSLIRASTTGSNRANVFVAMDAMDYQYAAGSRHDRGGATSACSFIPPARYVDFYLDDHYELVASGYNLATDPGGEAGWNGWLGCVRPQYKPIGLAEYGLNCGASGTGAHPNDLTTSEGMAADNAYLERQPDGLPVVLWEYWWDDNGDGSFDCRFRRGGSPAGTQAVQQWHANEIQNGGGAN